LIRVDAKIAGYSFERAHLRRISQQNVHAHRVLTADKTIATTMEDSAKFLHLTFDSGAEDAATAASSGTCDWSGDDTSMPAFPPPSFDRSTAELEAEPGWSILTSLVVLDFDFRRVKLCFRLASSFKCVRIQKHYATKIAADYLSQSNLDIRQLCVTRNFNRRTITFLRLLQRILSSTFKRS
jgi:hypothetical protein